MNPIFIQFFCTFAPGNCLCSHPAARYCSFPCKSPCVVLAKYCTVEPHRFTRAFVVNSAK